MVCDHLAANGFSQGVKMAFYSANRLGIELKRNREPLRAGYLVNLPNHLFVF